MTIETDKDGIFLASSFGWGTARDWARLGLLYAQNGIWNSRRILPGDDNIFRSATRTSSRYGAHFWLGGKMGHIKKDATAQACDAVFPSRKRERQDYLSSFLMEALSCTDLRSRSLRSMM